MAKIVKNLGIVKAIFVGVSAPSNTDAIWRDMSLAVPIHKYYNTSTGVWEPLINSVLIDNVTIKKDAFDRLYVVTNALGLQDNYRLGSNTNINGTTVVAFSSVLPSSNYFVEVLSYISTSGVAVKSGWSANSNNQVSEFTFIPPAQYPTGSLIYEAKLYK